MSLLQHKKLLRDEKSNSRGKKYQRDKKSLIQDKMF